jgi:hypothetical protein
LACSSTQRRRVFAGRRLQPRLDHLAPGLEVAGGFIVPF